MLKAPPAVEESLRDEDFVFKRKAKIKCSKRTNGQKKKMFISQMVFSADERKKLICLH